MGSLFSTPKPPQIVVPPAPPPADTTAEIKKKEEVRKLSLLRYYAGSNQTGLDVLRGTNAKGTGINL
jgi:hypothetical protein